MKNVFKKIIGIVLSLTIALSSLCIVNASASQTLPLDYASAAEIYKNTDYIIDKSSIYLLLEYEVGTGQSWSYVTRSSAEVAYNSSTVFTESGENYVGDKAIAMFRFDASSAGVFRVVIYLNQGGTIASDPVCFNFAVTGNDTDGYVFSERLPVSDKIPMDYYEAQQIDTIAVDGDLIIVCFENSNNEWSLSVSSTFTWQVVTSCSVPIQSVPEYALSSETAGYSVAVIKATSAGDGKIILKNSDGSKTLEYPVTVSASETGELTVCDNRIKYGDVNGDGEVNSVDAAIVSRASLGIYTLGESQLVFADVNGDGAVNSVDAAMITRYVLKILSDFPV